MHTLTADFGNAADKDQLIIDGTPQGVKIREACLYRLNESNLQDLPHGNDLSPVIQCGNEAWIVGSLAEKYQGKYNFESVDKLQQTREYLYASVAESMTLDRVLICVPDINNDDVHTLQSLLGYHRYKRNGNVIDLNINSIEPIDETWGAYLSCVALNDNGDSLFHSPEERNAILTIGGGTINGTLYVDGNIVSRWVSPLGVYTMATSIAASLKATGNLKHTPLASSVLSAIAKGHTHLKDVPMSEIFTKHRSSFVSEVQSLLMANWGQQEIEQICLVGGGAFLLDDYIATRPKFFRPENPQTFALEGLQYA
jgi:hypothetical protein